MTLPAPSVGAVYGQWTLKRPLGRGGNGEVWLGENASGERAAIKLLGKIKSTAYQRFKDEVAVMRDCGIQGVVPLIDASLPADPASDRPWYSMPVGRPLAETIDQNDLIRTVTAVAVIAEALAELHAKGIAHRDIKPANLLLLTDTPCIGDFGLVDYPEKTDVTGRREEVGPRWTMAPEVRREGALVDARPADVYSLAKTLWILITGIDQGFEGQYGRDSSLSIQGFGQQLFLSPLEESLKTATDHFPDRRPSMATFASQLRDWVRLQDLFQERTRLEWDELQETLFGVATPTSAEWTTTDDIVNVLNVLGSRSNVNHMFFPGGGGLDLEGATHSAREAGCIELNTGGLPSVLRPTRLRFESFAADSEWFYFRLEAGDLEPSGVYGDDATAESEEVTDLGDRYGDRTCWDDGEYNEQPLPETARPLMRYFRGSFVIFQKASAYNADPGTYDARHDKMTAEQFRSYIERNIARSQRDRG